MAPEGNLIPKPSGNGGGKNGGGGGEETIFAVGEFTGDAISGTGPAGQLITVRVTSACGTQTWEGDVTVADNGTWSIPLTQLVTADNSDGFTDNTGDYTVVAFYEEQKGRNIKITSTEPFPLTIDGPTEPTSPEIKAFVMEDTKDTGAKGDELTGDSTVTFRALVTDAAGNVAAAPTSVILTVEEPPAPDMDPLYAEQWNLAALGGIEDVWVDYTGVGVTVAVYDDGIEFTHVDLDDNYDASFISDTRAPSLIRRPSARTKPITAPGS
jgi:hypothetical protein